MAPLPEYRFGKVTGLTPDLTVISERSESPMVCCGYCSTQMACWVAVAGVSRSMKDEAHAMRACCGRPHNNGSKASELRNGAFKAVGVVLKSVAIADIPGRLQAGYAVVISLQYRDLPRWLTIQENDFGHSATLYGWSGASARVGYFDPLWEQGARGAWTPWDAVRDALWANGNHSTTVVKRGAAPPATGGDGMGIYWNPARWTASKDMDVFTAPDWADKVTTIKKGTVFTSLGPKAVTDADGNDKSARAVLVQTGGLVPGTTDPTVKAVLWAKGADFPPNSDPTSAEWDESIWRLAQNPAGRYPCPPASACTDEDLLKAKQEGYDLAMSPFPPRP